MNLFDPQLIFYLAVFLGTMLLVQGSYIYVTDRNRASKRVNQRMKLLARGASNAEVMSALRRDQTQARSLFAPPRITESGNPTNGPDGARGSHADSSRMWHSHRATQGFRREAPSSGYDQVPRGSKADLA